MRYLSKIKAFAIAMLVAAALGVGLALIVAHNAFAAMPADMEWQQIEDKFMLSLNQKPVLLTPMLKCEGKNIFTYNLKHC